MTLLEAHPEPCSFRHDAFIYDSDQGYTSTLVPLLAAAVEAGDTVLAVVPRHSAVLLRGALDHTAPIDFIDAATWYEHPITTIAGYERILLDLPPGGRALVIGEVQFGITQADWTGWTRYEAALNRVLERFDARVVCPYDARVLPPEVVADARRTHPHLLLGSDRQPSAHYVDAVTLFETHGPTVEMPLTPPALDLDVTVDLHAARHSFAGLARSLGLALGRVEQLTLAINELLTNALVHGGGSARLRVWSTVDGLVCAVEDSGGGIDDPLVGYTRPPGGSTSGYGTWLARRVFERTEFQSSSIGGLCVLASTRG